MIGLGPAEILIIGFVIWWGLSRKGHKKRWPAETRRPTGRGLGVVVVGVIFLAVVGTAVVGIKAIRTSESPIVQTGLPAKPLPSTQFGKTTSENAKPELIPLAEDPQQLDLPDWVKRGTHVVQEGVVPSVLVVTKSGQWPTQTEARHEALHHAKQELLQRMASNYDGIGNWNMPDELFLSIALKQEFAHSALHDFGNFKDTMIEHHIQFMDSPEVREHIADHWERFRVDRNLKNVGSVFAAIVLGLGLISLGLRGGSHLLARRHVTEEPAA